MVCTTSKTTTRNQKPLCHETNRRNWLMMYKDSACFGQPTKPQLCSPICKFFLIFVLFCDIAYCQVTLVIPISSDWFVLLRLICWFRSFSIVSWNLFISQFSDALLKSVDSLIVVIYGHTSFPMFIWSLLILPFLCGRMEWYYPYYMIS